VYRLLGPIVIPIRESSTNSREAVSSMSIIENCRSSRTRRGVVIARCQGTFTTKVSAIILSSKPTHCDFKSSYFKRYNKFEETELRYGFPNRPCNKDLREEEDIDTTQPANTGGACEYCNSMEREIT
jgi:hypothetical protein